MKRRICSRSSRDGPGGSGSSDSRNVARGQQGSVSVEFALVMPLLLIVIVGGVHFGNVLMTRHKLTEATNYATRAAAIAQITNPNTIRTMIQNRMGTGSGCAAVLVTTTTAVDALGTNRLEVRARCTLSPPFGSNLLGAVGPGDLTVTVAMPF
jgi:Flp pilus assembly protein TadG